jgi:hypothetical protein
MDGYGSNRYAVRAVRARRRTEDLERERGATRDQRRSRGGGGGGFGRRRRW